MSATFAKLASITFPAWIAKLFNEAPAMSELPVELPSVAAPAADIDEVVSTVAPAPDLIAKLESILAALGHELPVFWSEAVALAKKAL
ncbi:hypothetical protein [Pseudomonas saponiphila]|uniref:hypothetical protein n=1 Tax=Pseudomonas saponiphila TaxID=556534 RepID=UPI000B8438E8|nr:hypothetical protein [Pseudomonas saponiphila]